MRRWTDGCEDWQTISPFLPAAPAAADAAKVKDYVTESDRGSGRVER